MIILMESDETLVDRKAPTPVSICHLTEICLCSTYVTFKGNILQDMAMGSILVTIIANIHAFMEDFETTVLMSMSWPTMYFCYKGVVVSSNQDIEMGS